MYRKTCLRKNVIPSTSANNIFVRRRKGKKKRAKKRNENKTRWEPLPDMSDKIRRSGVISVESPSTMFLQREERGKRIPATQNTNVIDYTV